MTKTVDYTIHAPDEGPEMPEHFHLVGYRIYNDTIHHGDFPPGELWHARAKWIERGYERCDLEALAESVDLSDGGYFEIYCIWNESAGHAAGVGDVGDGQPFGAQGCRRRGGAGQRDDPEQRCGRGDRHNPTEIHGRPAPFAGAGTGDRTAM